MASVSVVFNSHEFQNVVNGLTDNCVLMMILSANASAQHKHTHKMSWKPFHTRRAALFSIKKKSNEENCERSLYNAR